MAIDGEFLADDQIRQLLLSYFLYLIRLTGTSDTELQDDDCAGERDSTNVHQ